MPAVLYRIDDRLIHGQVVVGWGQPLDLQFIVLVDDEIAGSDWEQELYRLAVPPHMSVHFHSVAAAARLLPTYEDDPQVGVVLTPDIDTMCRLVESSLGRVRAVNIGGIHHAPGRTQRLPYVFLTPPEEDGLRAISSLGAVVTAQDVPGARAVPLAELLQSPGES